MAKKKHQIYGTPSQGHLNPKARKEIARLLNEYDGKRLLITIERSYQKRSDSQNGYYWGCVIPQVIECMEEFWGESWSKDQAHDFCKGVFFGETKVNQETGTLIVQPGSSATCTTVEFEEVMADIRKWFVLEFGWMIPEPNEELDGQKLGEDQWKEHYAK